MDWTLLLFSFNGRTNRRGFWIAAASIAAISVVFAVLMFVVFGGPLTGPSIAFRAFLAANMIVSPASSFELLGILLYAGGPSAKSTAPTMSPAFSLVFGAIGLSLIGWLVLATGIKRLHDHGKRGSWMIIFLLFLLLLTGIAYAAGGIVGFIAEKAALAAITCGLVELGCLRGIQGPNEYGPDPLDAPTTPRSV